MIVNEECKKYREAISQALDGECLGQTPVWEAPGNGHEKSCPACGSFRADIISYQTLLSESRDKRLPENLLNKILSSQAPIVESKNSFGYLTRLSELISADTYSGNNTNGWSRNMPIWRNFSSISLTKLSAMLTVVLLTFLIVNAAFFKKSSTQNLNYFKSFQSAKGSSLTNGTLELTPSGEALLISNHGSRLKLWGGPGKITELLSAKDSNGGINLALSEGRICFEFNPAKSETLELKLGEATLKVIGTIWRVAFDSGKGYNVEVAQGKIRIASQGKTVEVEGLRKISIDKSGNFSAVEVFNPMSDPELGVPLSKFTFGER